VVSGQDVIMKISKTPTRQDNPVTPVKVISITMI
jgi:hypothetical protein